MLKKINSNKVESSDGFSVEFIGIHDIRYVEDGRELNVKIEGAEDDNGEVYFEIFTSLINSWDSPGSSDPISHEKRQNIIENLDASLNTLGVKHIFEEQDG
jgi:hypothetical protein